MLRLLTTSKGFTIPGMAQTVKDERKGFTLNRAIDGKEQIPPESANHGPNPHERDSSNVKATTPMTSSHSLSQVFWRRLLPIGASLLAVITTNVVAEDAAYPNGWPKTKIIPGYNCAPLTGHYKYVGEAIYVGEPINQEFDKYFMTMSYAFGGYPAIDEADGQQDRSVYQYVTVDISQSEVGGELRALIAMNNPRHVSSSLSLDISCANGWWASQRVFSGANTEGVSSNYKREVKLAKATDESLIVYNKYEGSSSKFFGLFSSPYRHEAWFRFLPTTP